MPTRASRIARFAVGVPLCFLLLQEVAFGQQTGARFLYGEGTPRFLTLPADFSAEQASSLASTASLPLWTGSFVYAGTTYSYNMVGTNPSVGSATTMQVIIVPLKFHFPNGVVLDPTAPAFGSSQSAVQSTEKSPIFQNAAFAPGGTPVGTTQYIDAFQRANFWSAVSTTSPGYHVLLTQPYVTNAVQINVPAGFGTTVPGPGSPIGEVSLFYFNLWLNAAMSQLTNVPSNDLLVFLTYNTFFTQSGSCCVLGFHSAYGSTPATVHTVAVAAYNDPGVFNVPIQDIHALSHEIAEWVDDPFGTNPVPGWSAGQAAGTCQTNLEVGDPVTGIAFDLTMNGMTYHPEDLVFLSWFARQTPSTAVNGWYTFLNSFSSPPAVCK